MDIDPFSMLEVSLQEPENEEGDSDCMEVELAAGSQKIAPFQSKDASRSVQLHPLFNSKEISSNPLNAVMANKERLAVTTKDEERYRKKTFSTINVVLRKRLHCTVCDAHIGAHLGLKNEEIEHPLLRVLICSRCTNKYRLMEFPLTPEGRDIRCRWCTSSSTKERPLRFCKSCPFAFCEMCIYKNLPLDELAIKDNWVCFVCNIQDLWPSRAVLWALRVLIDTNLAMNEDRRWRSDQSTCCKNAIATAPRPRNRVITFNRPPPAGVQFRPTLQTNGHLKSIVRPPQIRQRMLQPLQQQQQQQKIFQSVQQQQRQRIISSRNNGQQLYETHWLTDKIRLICNSLMTLHSNLTRLSSGIPDVENKYSIKSKLISMVSLLNISATQLQKASKDMEVESKRILDKNFRVTKVPAVEIVKTVTAPDVKPKVKNQPSELSPIITMTQTIKVDQEDKVEEVKPEIVTSEDKKIITKPCYVRLERLPVEDLARPAPVRVVQKEPQKPSVPTRSRSKNRKRKRKVSNGSRGKRIRGEVIDLDGDSQTGQSEYSFDEPSKNGQSRPGDEVERTDVVDDGAEAKKNSGQSKPEIEEHSKEIVQNEKNTNDRRDENGEARERSNGQNEDTIKQPEISSATEELRDSTLLDAERSESSPPVQEIRNSPPSAPSADNGEDVPTQLDNSAEDFNTNLDEQPTQQKDTALPVESPDDTQPSEVQKTDNSDEIVGKFDENLVDDAVEPATTTDSSTASLTTAPPASQQSEKLKKLLQRMQNNKV